MTTQKKQALNLQKIDKIEPLTLAWMLTIIQLLGCLPSSKLPLDQTPPF
jgi:hypothetical protein